MKKLIIGISGATGAIYAVRLLQVLKAQTDIELHLIITDAGRQTLLHETNYTELDLVSLAHVIYDNNNIAAPVASGSFRCDGMVILPCSIKSLSAIANSYTDNLITRAADVVLKERKPLVLCVRETPLHIGHLRLMTQAAENGAVIMPPLPAFYHHPQTLDDLIDQTVNRILDQFEISLPQALFSRWAGFH